jgi:hypothetical protein
MCDTRDYSKDYLFENNIESIVDKIIWSKKLNVVSYYESKFSNSIVI